MLRVVYRSTRCIPILSWSGRKLLHSDSRFITLNGRQYERDDWTNVPSSILEATSRRLHHQPAHPIALIRQAIESRFPRAEYNLYNDLAPVVTVHQNFDSLGFAPDHPGRSRTDTYYLNKRHVLRTHTSAHEAECFKINKTEGFLITADVYRRDAIDRTHYPAFHQMEGARLWDRKSSTSGLVAEAALQDIRKIPVHNMKVHDPAPDPDPSVNPIQTVHARAEAEAIAYHLKRTLEDVIHQLFVLANLTSKMPELRWVETFFPHTSPSYELEIMHQSEWLEVLGCGVISQPLLDNASVPDKLGWAFGMGLERIAMLLFGIPDIRLFWSRDSRFLGQFSTDSSHISQFVPFSKYPPCPKDLAFWLPDRGESINGGTPKAAGAQELGQRKSGAQDFHENDFMEVARELGGDLVEDVQLVDEFKHPKTGRRSVCYRIVYRSLERTLTNEEVKKLHQAIAEKVRDTLQVELR